MKKLSRLLLALLMLSVLLLPALELEVQAYWSIYLRVYDRCTNTYMGIPIHVTGNGAFSKFTGVKVDGKVLDPENYTAEEGSTVVTLKESWLDRQRGRQASHPADLYRRSHRHRLLPDRDRQRQPLHRRYDHGGGSRHGRIRRGAGGTAPAEEAEITDDMSRPPKGGRLSHMRPQAGHGNIRVGATLAVARRPGPRRWTDWSHIRLRRRGYIISPTKGAEVIGDLPVGADAPP